MVAPQDKGVVVVAHSNKPLSIIIPVYDDWGSATELLRSLQPVREKGVELLIVNGQPASEHMAQALHQMVDVFCTTQAGRARQMNCGAAKAKGQVFLFLHADSVFDLPLFDVFLQGNSLVNRWGFFKISLQPSFGFMSIVAAMMNFRSGLSHIATGDQGIWVGRSLFENVGGFPDQLLMEDIELCRRLSSLQAPQKSNSVIISSSRRWQSNGQIKTILSMWWLRLQYWMGVDPNKLALRYYPHLSSLLVPMEPKLKPDSVCSQNEQQ